MSKQLTLPLNHTSASKPSGPQLSLQLQSSDWIQEAVERYERKKKSKQYEKTVRLQK